MLRARQIGTTLGWVWAGGWLGRLVIWIAGLDDGSALAALIVCAALGGLIGVAFARTLEPWDAAERRDAVVGWSIVGVLIGLIGVVALIESL